jgi:ribosomal-protein-alanine acetyltransferase
MKYEIMKIKIIELSSAHLPPILEIERETFSDAWSENMFLELLSSPLAHGFIAENDGELSGFILFYLLPPEMQILNIAVRESARNQSVGSLLLKSALESPHIDLVTLEVRESNIPAINLYKKFGFKTDGIRKNYYRKPKENAVLMSLDLDN